MNGPLATVGEADKKMAAQIMLGVAVIAALMGILAIALGGTIYGIIYFAVGGGLYYANTRALADDFKSAKAISLVAAGILLLLGVMALPNADMQGGLGMLIALVLLGGGGGLVYAAMLVSPGRKLF